MRRKQEATDSPNDRVGGKRPTAAEIFTRSGFLGIAEGPEDLSSRYKEYLTEGLAPRA